MDEIFKVGQNVGFIYIPFSQESTNKSFKHFQVSVGMLCFLAHSMRTSLLQR